MSETIYFKKNDGEVIIYQRGRMSLERLDAKFSRCNKDGSAIATPKKKKAAKKGSKK